MLSTSFVNFVQNKKLSHPLTYGNSQSWCLDAHRVFQKEYVVHLKNVPCFKLHRYNQTHVYPKLKIYTKNDVVNFKERYKLYTYKNYKR